MGKMPMILCPDVDCPLCKAGVPRFSVKPIFDCSTGKTQLIKISEKVAEKLEDEKSESEHAVGLRWTCSACQHEVMITVKPFLPPEFCPTCKMRDQEWFRGDGIFSK